MTSSQSKGKNLEEAIKQIETAILKSDPSLKEGAFRIEPRKIIQVAGVHHEIDIYVTITHVKSYDSVYIFEAKNWEEKVGKNEVINFSEKIKAASAQKGFFVAKNYTKDAENQAVLDSRLELLRVTEDFEVDIPDTHILLREKPGNINISLIGNKNKPLTASEAVMLSISDQDKEMAEINGVKKMFKDFINDLYEKAVEDKLNHEPTNTFTEGEHILKHKIIVDYVPALNFQNKTFERVEAVIEFPIKIIKPQIVSRFDIKTRGRITTLEAVGFNTDNSITLSFIGHS